MKSASSLVLVAGCLLVNTGCRTLGKGSETEVKIFNGAVADNHQIVTKSTVALLTGGQQFCTGTLLDGNFSQVVAAAHCFVGLYDQLRVNGVEVGFGTGPVFSETRKVKKVMVHAGYQMVEWMKDLSDAWEATHPHETARLELLQAKQQDGTITAAEKNEIQQTLMAFANQNAAALADPDRVINDLVLLNFEGFMPGAAGSDGSPSFKDVNIATDSSLPSWLLVAGFGMSADQSDVHGILKYGWMLSDGPTSRSGEIRVRPSPQTNGVNTCHGDSGGPLYIYNWSQPIPQGQPGFQWPTVVGALSRATSLTNESCGGDTKAIYTDLRFHQGWIGCQSLALLNIANQDCQAFTATEMSFQSTSVPGPAVFPTQPPPTPAVFFSLAERIELVSYELKKTKNPSVPAAQGSKLLKWQEMRHAHLLQRAKAAAPKKN